MTRRRGGYRVGFDIGGTFTDYVLIGPIEDGGDHAAASGRLSGGVALHKRLSTPRDPAGGALAGLDELLGAHGLTLADVDTLVHGTTLVTNAVIERRGARTALLTTRGFRDVLAMGKEQRYDIYDLFLRFPEPLVPRRWRREVDERVTRDGEVRRPVDLDQVRAVVAELIREGVESIAVAFLHAYRNPVHEQAVGAMLREAFPGLSVSLSSEVVPEIREYERTSTTVCNAYVQPLVQGYLRRLETELRERGFRGRFYLMQSSGGLASPEMAARFPVRLLESGPAGGALVTSFFGRLLGQPDLLAFDMGGTTAKSCLILAGQPDIAPVMEAARVHRFKRGSGLPVQIPVVDMIEIGAGGGSIARIDSLGLLKVGPESAGADPGPACYGRGGREPTVTDACLLLGYFDPEYFLGGRMRLDPEAARAAIETIGRRLNLSPVEAAWGIHQVVCENMASAARVHIIEKGGDPRRFAMMAFGGAGPAHAVRVARRLGTPEVIVPPASGAASALGFLVAPVSFEFVRSLPGELAELDWAEIDRLFAGMEDEARAMLRDAGVEPAAMRLERSAEMRLAGQFHDIRVPVPAGRLDAGARVALEAAFRTEYERLYHTVLPGYAVQALNWRLLAVGPQPDANLPAREVDRSADASVARKGVRRAYMPEAGGFVDVPVFDRYRLPAGACIEGPAIVEEAESTTVVCPGDCLLVDGRLNLRIRVGGAT